MRLAPLALFPLCAAALTAPGRDEPAKSEPAKAPPGWRYVEAKDRTYKFLFPAKTSRSGTRERTIRSGRLSLKSQVNYCVTPGGVTYAVEAVNVGGAVFRGLKQEELDRIILDGEKSDGYEVTEPDPVMAGKFKGREFFAGKPNEIRRVVLIGARPRLFALWVGAKTKEDTADEKADTFVRSLELTPRPAGEKAETKPAAKGDGKEPANPGEGGSAEWTTDVSKMTFPDAPASGRIMGAEFKVESAVLEGTGLTLRTGKGFHPDAAITVVLFKQPAAVAGQTYQFGPKGGAQRPHIRLARMAPGEKVPTLDSFVNGYALKLEFGAIQGGKVAGKIYACLPDKNKSVVAGTFEADVK